MIWDAPIAVAGLSMVLFNTVIIGEEGGGIGLFQKVGTNSRISIGYTYFDDNEPNFPALKMTSKDEDFKNTRTPTYGTYFNFRWNYKRLLLISIAYHKDLKAHHGDYIYSRLMTSAIPFITFGLGLGHGDHKNNKYIYGFDGTYGFGHADFFASLRLPLLPGKGQLIVSFRQSSIIKNRNQNADRIRGKNLVRYGTLSAMWNL